MVEENEENSKCQSTRVGVCGSGKRKMMKENEEDRKCQSTRFCEGGKNCKVDTGNGLDEGKKEGEKEGSEKHLLRSIKDR